MIERKKQILLIGAQEPPGSRLKENSNVFKGIPPYFTPYGKDFMVISRKAYSFPAYALPILASCVISAGSSVSYLNDFYSENPDDIARHVKNTDIAVGISTTFLTNKNSIINIIKFVKNINPRLKIIMGGPGIINFPAVRKYADINVFYEGEEAMREVAYSLCRGKSVCGIRGLSYLNSGREIFTPKRECLKDLGGIPMPQWESISDKIKKERYLPIESSRGCVGNCSFCLETKYWPGVRFYPIPRVIKEIRHGIRKFGVRHYYFQDSNISNKREYLSGLCESIVKEDLKINWCCESRIDTLTKELLDKMFASGCRGITFGMESADERVLRNMNKALSAGKLESFRKMVRYMRSKKMLANINIIIGFPGEDKKSIENTVKFLLSARPFTYSMSKFFLEKGTGIWKERKRFKMEGSMFKWRHDTMSADETDDVIRHIFLKVSADPGICHWASASVDLIRHMASGKTMDGFMKYIKAVNLMCSEDMTRKRDVYSQAYGKSFRYIKSYLL